MRFKIVLMIILIMAAVSVAAFISLNSGTRVSTLLAPQIVTADDTSSVVDMTGWASTMFTINVGEIGAGDTISTSKYLDLYLMHGDESDGSDLETMTLGSTYSYGDFETSSSGLIKRINTTAEDSAVYTIEYGGRSAKNYAAIKYDFTGNWTIAQTLTQIQAVAPFKMSTDSLETSLTALIDSSRYLIMVGLCDDSVSLAADFYIDFVMMEGDSANGNDLAACDSDDDILESFESASTGIIKRIDAATDDSNIYTATYCGTKDYSAIKVVQYGDHSTGLGTEIGISVLTTDNGGIPLSITAHRNHAESKHATDYE